METKKGLTKTQKITFLVIGFIGMSAYFYWDYTRIESDIDANTRQIQLMNLKGVTHYYWEYEPGTFRSDMFRSLDDAPIPVTDTFSVYAESGSWIRVHYLHEITPDHYLELEVEVVVIR